MGAETPEVRRQGVSRRLVATALIASALTLSTPMSGRAQAIDGCTTKALGAGQQAKLPYVFTGTVTDVAESAKAGEVTRIYTVKVDRWWAGELPERVRVVSPAAASDCGLRGVRKGTEHVFFGDEGADGQIEALSFQGTTKVTGSTQRHVTDQMGTRAQKPVIASDSTDAPDELAPTELDTSEPPSVSEAITVPAVVVVAGLLIFGIGALLGRRPS